MQKVLFVATVVKKHIMQFHVPYLEMFKESGWETAVAARNDYEEPISCSIPHCDRYFDVPFERNPANFGNVKAYKKLKNIIKDGHYDIIHCHTPMGAVLTRIAARKCRKNGTKVIYTAHGFHFFKGAPLSNWLLYYPVEKWLSRYTDTIITINREDYEAAKRFHMRELFFVHGVGVDTQRFSLITDRREKRSALGLRVGEFALLSVGELIPRKNHEIVLRALSILRDRGELKGIIYYICGEGPLENKLKKLADELNVADYVHFLGYRSDVAQICKASDLFVFMSHQEGLPVALMEAMACGLPCICSGIRGNTDLISNGVNGFVIESTPNAVANAIMKLKEQREIGVQFGKRAQETMADYDISAVKQEMEKIYFPKIAKS